MKTLHILHFTPNKEIITMAGFEPAVTAASKPFGLPSYFYPPLPAVPPVSRRGFTNSPSHSNTFQVFVYLCSGGGSNSHALSDIRS